MKGNIMKIVMWSKDGVVKDLVRGSMNACGWGVVLIFAGFQLDGLTEVGHHAMLIAGGIVVGWKARMEWRGNGRH